jgi:ATP-dependent DNA helicase MPH1
VFTNYRKQAKIINDFLKEFSYSNSLIKSDVFLGKKDGVTQQIQKDVIKNFSSGKINTIIATSVAEEGLDIGNVDLIISYDALKSPIRMVQRMGRTGRSAKGKVIIFISEG